MTPSEIAKLMQEIVGLDDIEVDDNFFEFGGNSLLLLTLLARIQERAGIMLRLLDVVREPTAIGVSELLALESVSTGDK